MVTAMTEQPGPRDPAERRASDRPGKGVDVFGDLQRWFIRQSAKNMRNQISGQVRRTLGGGRETSDVWDTATNEIPPEVGESPECQWCPICRAARRMREAGPGIGGQLSGAGDAVATVVQDAISALDSILSKAGGSDQRAASSSRPAGPPPSGSAPAGTGRDRADGKPAEPRPGRAGGEAADRPAARGDGSRGASGPVTGRARGAAEPQAPKAGEHGPGGWKPGDRLATEHVIDPDPWAGATESDDGMGDTEHSGAEAGAAPQGRDEAQLDGQGHGPDDRG